MLNNKNICAITLLLVSSAASSQDFDFMLGFVNCKALIGAVMLVEEPIAETDGDPVQLFCTRASGSMSCTVIPKGGEPTNQSYPISIDVGSNLVFGAANGSDYFNINTSSGAAVMTSRTVRSDMLATKLCHGLYLTKQELELMRESAE